ncbi:MAG: HD domain-containing protein [Lachnospiraceae bacterium]|nr:HD domain-containing protein [Lachnospiraceae bacterium]
MKNLIEKGLDIQTLSMMIEKFGKENNLKETLKALEYATKMHDGQLRDEGTPYIIHPLQITCHMIANGISEDEMLSSALLHDVCEDCDVEVDELPFSDEIREAVSYLTHKEDKHLEKGESKKLYFRRLHENRIAALVKVYDRCNNISSMSKGFDDEHIEKYMKETLECVYPLMDEVEELWPEYSFMIYEIRYHMDSVLHAILRRK